MVYGIPRNANRPFELNSASEEMLACLPRIGPVRARAISQRRPFSGWHDLEQVPGISEEVLHELKAYGARLGA